MENKRLNIIWSSDNRETALKLVFMYAHNSLLKKWWSAVQLIVWGPSMKLLINDIELQERLKSMQDDGVSVVACKRCADEYGISSAVTKLDIELKYMGEPLTELLQDGEKVITF